jgi:hypothetical protein
MWGLDRIHRARFRGRIAFQELNMYIRTPMEIGREAPLLGQSGVQRYRPPFTKGGAAIGETDGQKLLTILAGPSPYRDYILPAMATQGSALPKNFFRIVTDVRTQVPAPLQGLFRASDNKLVAGTVDRWTRTIYMIPAPGLRGETRLEFALHEAVHLFAHPVIPPKGSYPRICVGTFQRTYGPGFGEGATQVITEDIMAEQGISKYYRERPYDAFTPPVRELMKIFSVGALARAYFWGATQELTAALESRWGKAWRNVANFTSAKETKKAYAPDHRPLGIQDKNSDIWSFVQTLAAWQARHGKMPNGVLGPGEWYAMLTPNRRA